MKFGTPPWRANPAPPQLEPPRPQLEPTAADLKNGWNAETLSEYHAMNERRALRVVATSMFHKPRPKWANSKYRPLRGLRRQH